MFDNGLPLFVTKSRKIGLTVEFLPSGTADSLHSYLTKVVRFYKRTGLLVEMCLMDMEFEVLESKSENALVNCVQLLGSMLVTLNDLLGLYKRERERARFDVSELPFGHCMPDAMVIQLIYNFLSGRMVPLESTHPER
jgi:hypothetical protein